MTEPLYDVLLTRLANHPPKRNAVAELVAAAWDGPEAVDAQLKGAGFRSTTSSLESTTQLRNVYITSIEVEGFRGAGPAVRLDLEPGPGLTLLVGRNGSGKSTFAEALELLLTGTTMRWAEKLRSKVWRDGWRNLASPLHCRIAAKFLVEGYASPVSIERSWEELDDLRTIRQTVGGAGPAADPGADLTSIGWVTPLATYRPFLPHSELSTLLTGPPTELYEALQRILGLEDLTRLNKTLRDARIERTHIYERAEAGASAIRLELVENPDDRAAVCISALDAIPWDLARLEAVLERSPGAEPDGRLRVLRAVENIELPSADLVSAVAVDIRDRQAELLAHAGTDAEEGDQLAELLELALRFHANHRSGDCPVCGSKDRLTNSWAEGAKAQILRLRTDASGVRTAKKEVASAIQRGRALVSEPAAVLGRAGDLGLDTGVLVKAWIAWAAGALISNADDLASHLENQFDPLATSAEAVRTAASEELAQLEDAWRPFTRQLRSWLEQARPALRAKAEIPTVKTAEDWVNKHTQAIRDERVEPISLEVQRHWNQLRQDSSVSLSGLRLEGKATTSSRHVELDVGIDGKPGAALGVMSQGELNCLALSIFLPRATLADSPFRFIVIDDPVQAMDPAKVDGLARVLGEVAAGRQVIVLTHDERLPEAVRRLGIPSRILEVTRRQGSVIELRPSLDPVRRALEDAWAVANTEALPAGAARVVPGLCAIAVEAACLTTTRRRRLERGEDHSEVEEMLRNVNTVNKWVSLALFDSPDRGGDVLASLNSRFGPQTTDVFQAIREGKHKGTQNDLAEMVRLTGRLADGLAALK